MRPVDGPGEECLVRVGHERVIRVVDGPFDLGVDHTARQHEITRLAAKEFRELPCDGSPSTDAVKIELVMLPAIRAFIVPPFWAMGSMLLVMGLIWGLATVGGSRRRRRRDRPRRGSAADNWRT